MANINVTMLLSTFNKNQLGVQDLNTDYEKSVTVINSGGLGGLYSEMGTKNAANFITAEADLKSIDARANFTNGLLQTQNRVNTLIERAQVLNTDILGYLNLTRQGGSGYIDSASFSRKISDTITELVRLLNTSDQGKYLFSGTDSVNAAVDDTQLTALPDTATADTSYYKGGPGSVLFQLDETRTYTKYSILASDSCFEKTFRALRICKNITNTVPVITNISSTDININSAIELLTQASQTDYPIALYAGYTQSRILRDSMDQSSTDTLVTRERLNDVGSQDIFSAFMRVQLLKSNIDISVAMSMQELKIIEDIINKF